MAERSKQFIPSYFKVPDAASRKEAIGGLGGVQPRIKKAITAITSQSQTIEFPSESDWLWDHEEEGQTYESYKTSDKRSYDKDNKNSIYIQPLESNIGINQELKEFCTAFFYGCKIKLNARNIMDHLQQHIPKDAICVIGITKIDLYPKDEWNYVFGIGSLFKGVGVFSFARYMRENGDMLSPNIVDNPTLLYRAAKIMAHEISHMFGLKHCIYHKCLLNGQNHLEESDRTPLELCVICIRKLQSNIGFPFLDRYKALIEFCNGRQIFQDKDVQIFQKLYQLVLDEYGPHYAPK